MAANQSAVLLLLALLCLTAASSVSAGYVVNGKNIAEVAILGRLYCSVTGNLLPGAFGLRGANVSLVCGGSSTDLAHAVTDITGTYAILLSLLDGIAFDPSKCYVIVKLPIAKCAVLPPTGTLRAPITLLNVVPSVIGDVANLQGGLWTIL